MGLEALPEGDWYCPRCRCAVCGSGAGFSGAPLRGGAAAAWASTAGYAGPDTLAHLGQPVVVASMPGVAAAPAAAAAAAAAAPLLPAADGAAAGDAEPMQVDGLPPPPPQKQQPPPQQSGAGTADFSAILDALEQEPEPAPPPEGEPSGEAAVPSDADVRCACSGRRRHGGCLPPGAAEQLRLRPGEPWYESAEAAAVSRRLAALAARGVVPIGAAAAAAPASDSPLAYSFQLVRGAAAAAPGTCRGATPAYDASQRAGLQPVLSAALALLHAVFEPLPDSRTGADVLPWLLRGAVLADGGLDLSGCHAALLYAGGALVAVALLRALGPQLAELPLLAVRPEVQQNRLGPLLLSAVEAALAGAGVRALLAPAFVAPGIPHIAFPEAPEAAAEPLPLLQARWGYRLAPPELALAAAPYPLLRLPGLLLASKALTPEALLPPPPLPAALVWNAAADARALVRQGLAAPAPQHLAAALAAAAAAAQAEPAKPELQQQQAAGPAQVPGAAEAEAYAAAAVAAAAAAGPAQAQAAQQLAGVQAVAQEHLAQRRELPSLTEKMLQSLQQHGGTSSAAVPVAQQLWANAASWTAGAAAMNGGKQQQQQQ